MATLNRTYTTVTNIYWLLRISYGLFWTLAGIDKLSPALYFIVNWQKYVSTKVLTLTGLNAPNLLIGVGFLEIIIGLLILSGKTKIGAYLSIAWFTIIIINLFFTGQYFDIIVRDLVITIGLFSLAQITDIKNELAGYTKA